MALIRLYNLTLGLDDDERALKRAAAARLEVAENSLTSVSLVKRGVDARKRVPVYNCTADVEVALDVEDVIKRLGDNARVAPSTPPLTSEHMGARELRGRPLVVGSGPAGAFAAYALALNGLKPLLIERGPPALERLQQIGRFNARVRDHDPESNALFGEGGAGSFSDGKLWTSNRDPYIPRVLELFVKCGAPARILTDASPHVGTDILARVVVRMRDEITRLGGELRFKARLDDLEIADGEIRAACLPGGERLDTNCLLLAPGHSARDTYAMLHARGLSLEQKPFQLGVRIEHPQEIIDNAQLSGKYARDPRLAPASYDLSCRVPGAPELYSFCMCPGGVTIAAISEPGMLCTNGMSYSVRASGYANSALVTTFAPADYGGGEALAGIEFQRRFEKLAFDAGGGDYTCPAQPVTHLLRGLFSPRPMKGSYTRGRKYVALEKLLPEKLMTALRAGLSEFDKRIRGFVQDNGIVHAIESRASGPVRIVRDNDTRESVNLRGLYPCGEGAGYAGGIVSAACDGIKSALAIVGAYSRR